MAKGWHQEPRRHADAARGVKTARDNHASVVANSPKNNSLNTAMNGQKGTADFDELLAKGAFDLDAQKADEKDFAEKEIMKYQEKQEREEEADAERIQREGYTHSESDTSTYGLLGEKKFNLKLLFFLFFPLLLF